MLYKTTYHSPIGNLLLVSNENSLLGIWIENQKYYLANIKEPLQKEDNLDIFIQTKNWLDRYFQGEKPNISALSLVPRGSKFRQTVWQCLLEIPYGKVITYGELAKTVAKKLNKKTMSAQAIGGAVGHNPISIIIPCHRVVGSNKSLTGYAGGIEKKTKLLELEGIEVSEYIQNKKS